MKFGPLPLEECAGAVLAHALKLDGGRVWRKGAVLEAADLDAIRAAGLRELIVARLEPGDVAEDEAAERIAAAIAGSGVTLADAGTGRVNLHAAGGGLFRVKRAAVDAINQADPGITLATLADFTPVEPGRMVATVKIIPYAVPGAAIGQALSLVGNSAAVSVLPWQAQGVGVISTRLPSLKDQTIRKTLSVLEQRLAPSASRVIDQVVIAHEREAVRDEIARMAPSCDMLVIFGASAISDAADIIPAALEDAGGEVTRFGMPVDPGNLLMLGQIGGKPVLGAPGCARSPAENGFDWVLQRLLAGLDVTSEQMAGMGVGGLLMEIGSRPRPRELLRDGAAGFRPAAILLAAGRSTRMGSENKLLAAIDGQPMVRHAAQAAEQAGRVICVTGHEASSVREALSGLDITFAHNPAFAEGLSASLRAGIRALAPDVTHAVILLGDMPGVTPAMIARLADAARENPRAIIAATANGRRGNPVVWPKAFFEQLMAVSGDKGARDILEENAGLVVSIEIGEAASLDIDTPEALKGLRDARQAERQP